jgi:hypothetical protein
MRGKKKPVFIINMNCYRAKSQSMPETSGTKQSIIPDPASAHCTKTEQHARALWKRKEKYPEISAEVQCEIPTNSGTSTE